MIPLYACNIVACGPLFNMLINAESPGFNINFESAPFKLTNEYIELLGGLESAEFRLFEDLLIRGFFAIRKHIEELAAMVQVPRTNYLTALVLMLDENVTCIH